MKNWKKLVMLFFGLAFAVALHQYLNWGIWFDTGDIHHELFIAMFGFTAFVLWYMNKGED